MNEHYLLRSNGDMAFSNPKRSGDILVCTANLSRDLLAYLSDEGYTLHRAIGWYTPHRAIGYTPKEPTCAKVVVRFRYEDGRRPTRTNWRDE